MFCVMQKILPELISGEPAISEVAESSRVKFGTEEKPEKMPAAGTGNFILSGGR